MEKVKRKHNGGGGEKAGFLFEKRFHDLLDANGIKHRWNRSSKGIDFPLIEVRGKVIFADCKGQNGRGTAYDIVPTTIYKYVTKLDLDEMTIIRGKKKYPEYVLEHISFLEKQLDVKVYIKTPQEFMTWAKNGKFIDVKPLEEYKEEYKKNPSEYKKMMEIFIKK